MTTEAAVEAGWYITRTNGKSDGPLTDPAMRIAIGNGHVKPEDYVWREGMDAWVEAREIPNFFDVRKAYHHPHRETGHGTVSNKKNKEKIAAQPWSSNISPANRNLPTSPASAQDDEPWGISNRPNSQAKARMRDASRDRKMANRRKPPSPVESQEQSKQVDFEKVFASLSRKIGKIPAGAIAFFVLGFFIVPMLPLFWFIAWRIWAKANKTRRIK
ncbi:MAG: DUF4339 domain-containing protein [Hyphomicrobiaceae bacterium]|nr:DUF4339 domain-containing protein [Hyphomicrobiaceae bacterium]MCC0010551.1 DUF4339 domain-containing protein [Hyphomicrobiaceae bacterium]